MTPNQLAILQHALGVDQYGRGRMYRSHFVTNPETDDGKICQELVDLGFMTDLGPQGDLTGGSNLYDVTASGIAAMTEESPDPPKLTRAQQRYLKWLEVSDAFPSDWTFGDYLKNRKYEQA